MTARQGICINSSPVNSNFSGSFDKQRQRKQRNRKLAPEKKKKNNFGQRLQQKRVERKAATKNMEEEEEEKVEYKANGARIWKKPKPRTNSLEGLD